ncbi:MAG: hypothetical protein BroJett038_24300 [Chloroflexota bacterium]|jgi:hypothetical protein|nr:MAG: hypothetical protein BroJett038_24300 [Chloroflexota bacterium]
MANHVTPEDIEKYGLSVATDSLVDLDEVFHLFEGDDDGEEELVEE